MSKKALTNNAVLVARDNLPGLLSNLTSFYFLTIYFIFFK